MYGQHVFNDILRYLEFTASKHVYIAESVPFLRDFLTIASAFENCSLISNAVPRAWPKTKTI